MITLTQDILIALFDARAVMAYGLIRDARKDRNRDALDKLIT